MSETRIGMMQGKIHRATVTMADCTDAYRVIGLTERASYILRVRELAKASCEKYLEAA